MRHIIVLISCIFLALGVHAQTVEVCNDGIDNDGNGLIDCADPFCSFAANVEKGCNCFDSIDNDGDGVIDKADPNCAAYYGLSFVGEGSNCSITPPGTATPFAFVGPPTVSGQNTADTQAKVAVGDVDGDGIPDVIISSKWNRQIRVVATTDGQADGSDAGDIKSDFKTTGAGASIFPKSADKLLYEHEVLIADINKDGKGEIFGIVSDRKNASEPPQRFFLVGFTYTPATLTPLFNAVDLGPDRPGIPGIADMDGDGKAEIYLRDRIYAAETGGLLATGGGVWDLDVSSGSVAVNILGDTKMELVVGTKIYSIPSLTNRNPAVSALLTLVQDMNTFSVNKCFVKLANDPIEYGVDTHSATSVADVDGDGFLDVVISGALNSNVGKTAVFYWNVNKGTVSHFLPPDPVFANGWPWGTGRVNLGDANGDGKIDLSFVAGSRLFCLTTDAAGTGLISLWATPRTINDSRSGVVAVTIYDFDNDGNPEMVYRDSQEIVIIDGATGQNKIWSAVCQSHTYTEGPVIADVNGDGATDICVTCAAAKFDVNDPIQQQALGEVRIFFSNANNWLPTRKVWNQPGYFVVNINDNLTLPFPQLDQSLIFSNSPCPNGLPGPQRPLNQFMNQVPFLSAEGCPVFPAPDLAYFGDDPANPGVDIDGDGVYNPAVVVTPPICGNLDISAFFNIINSGDLPITDNVPVGFFNGDPLSGGTYLHNAVLNIANLQVGQTLVTPAISFNGPGTVFTLYIVLYSDGSLPLVIDNTKECSIANNTYTVLIAPDPFTVTIEKVSDNFKCDNTAPDNGELRAHIFKGAVEVLDYSPFSFQWYSGAGTGSPIPGPAGTDYLITDRAEGDYTIIVTNTLKGCASDPVTETIVRLGNDPDITINVLSDQTQCSPANGQLEAVITGGNTGFTFEWFDIALNPLGIVGPIANNLTAGNYLVRVSKDGCTKISNPATVNGPQIPDAQAQVIQHVIDCSNPTGGIIQAEALFNAVVQDPALYKFDWYFYDNATSTRGSILPPANGVGQTRTDLAAGFYQAEIKQISTQCVSTLSPVVEVQTQTIIPTAVITELAPQTSCDLSNPNGILTADAYVGGVLQDPSTFTFEWFKGDNTIPPTHPTVSGINGKQADKVSGGGIYYTVKITTGNNCSVTEKFIITENIQVPVVALTPTPNSICDPAKASSTYNGSVSAAVTFNGVPIAPADPNYVFVWHDGSLPTDPSPSPNSTTNLLSQQDAGNYTLVVTRTDLSCVSLPQTEQVINATVLPALTTSSAPSTNCTLSAGLEDGTASIVTVDAGAPLANYTFAWTGPVAPVFPVNIGTNNSNTPQLIKLQGGAGYDYSVLVTNPNSGCESTAVVNVGDAKVLPVITLAPTDNGICDPLLTVPAKTFSGKITATVTNQIGLLTDYTFVFGAGMGPGVASANVYDQLNGGPTAYTATTTHTLTGCASSQVSQQVANVQTLPVLTTSSTPSTNCTPGLEDGQTNVLTVDGTAVGVAVGYTYAWTGPVAPAFPVGAINNFATPQLIKLQGGVGYDYTALVTNQGNGCKTSVPLNVADAKVLPVITLAPTDNGICDPALTFPAVTYNGKITATVTNQIGLLTDYTFAFGAGMGPGVASANVYDQLDGGPTAYTATTTHTLTGCVSSQVSQQVANVQTLPVLTTSTSPSTNCTLGLEDGQANVLTVDGTAVSVAVGYTYAWTGPVAPAFLVGAINNFATPQLIKLQGGVGYDYTALVTNQGNGCQTSIPLNVPDAKIIPVITLAPTDNSICDPALTFPAVAYSGKITATVTNQIGLLADYTFVFGVGMGPGVVSANIYDQLNGGPTAYTGTATHSISGCVSTVVSQVVSNVQTLPILTTSASPSTNCVAGLEDGQVDVVTVDGTPVGVAVGYRYAWTGPVAPPFPVGAANNFTTPQLIKLQGGAGYDYTALVINQANGCQTSIALNVVDSKVLPTLTMGTTNNTICDPALTSPAAQFNGSVAVTVTNLIAPITDYSFEWHDGPTLADPLNGSSTIQNLLQLDGGFYTVAATHTITGCISSATTAQVVDTQLLPVISSAVVGSTNCIIGTGLENGQAQVTSVDGSGIGAPYVFEWYDGNSVAGPIQAIAATYANVQGGAGLAYTALVTNQNTGCQNTTTLNVPDESAKPVITLASLDNTICAPALANPILPGYNGQITVSSITYKGIPYGGPSTLTYNWFDGVGTAVPHVPPPVVPSTIDQLAKAFYSSTLVIDDLGCESDFVSAEVEDNLTLPVVARTPTPSTNCAGPSNGSITSLGDGTTVGYRFQWYQGTDITSDPQVPSAPNNGNTPTTIQLQGGQNFTVEVIRDVNGCANTSSVFLVDASEKPIISVAVTQNNINCDIALGSTGALVATVNYKGAPVLLPDPNYTITWSTTDTGDILAGQPAAIYSATVEETVLQCVSDPDQATVLDVFDFPVITTTVLNDQTSCDDVLFPNGQIQGSATGGPLASIFTFTWHQNIGTGGPVLATSAGNNSGDFLNTNPNRPSGNHTFFVRNETTGCESTRGAFIPNNITFPAISFGAIVPVTTCVPANGGATPTLTNVSPVPGTDFSIFYVRTYQSFAPPTDPLVVKASPETYSSVAPVGVGNPPAFTDLEPGFLTGLVIDNNTKCESNVTTVAIPDATTPPTITFNGNVPAGFCTTGLNGEIDVTVAGGSLPYAFNWYQETPVNTNINFFNNPPDMGVVVPIVTVGPPEDLVAPGLVPSDTYTLVVTDNVGCGAYFIDNVPYIGSPVILATLVKDNEKCDALVGPLGGPVTPDGSIDINVTGVSAFGYTVNVYDGSSEFGPLRNVVAGLSPIVFTESPLAAGEYFVHVIDNDPANSPCPLGKQLTVKQIAFKPLITINQIDPNTTCDPLVFGDGKVSLTADDDPRDMTAPPPSYEILSINPVPLAYVPPTPLGTGVPSGLISGFGTGNYTIRVQDLNSECFTDTQVNIPDQPGLPNVFTVAETDDSFCAPTSSGQIEVTGIGPGAISDYDFEWYSDAGLATLEYTEVGGGATQGEIYNIVDPGWILNPTAGLGNGNRQYYVRGLKNNGVGAGCYTTVEQVVTQDTHVTPNLALSSMPNTSCDPAIGEGSILVVTDIASPEPLVQAGTYAYAWLPDPTTTSPQAGVARLATLTIPNLPDNGGAPYAMTSTNSVSGCAVSGNITILPNKYNLDITANSKLNKLLCSPDGTITATEITIDRSLTSLANLVFNTPLAPNFEFRWFKGVPGTFASPSRLEDGFATVMDTEVLNIGSAVGEFPDALPTNGAGTYYVVARQLSAPGIFGANCEAAPLKVEILDKKVDPTTVITPFANTGCAGFLEGELKVDITDNTDPSIPRPFVYDYTWDVTNPTAVPNSLANNGNGINDGDADRPTVLLDGNYKLLATNTTTGCVTPANASIVKNSLLVEVVTGISSPQQLCLPADGSIQVTSVAVNSAPVPLGSYDYQWKDQVLANLAPDPGNVVLVNNLPIGTYYVVATRNTGAAQGCSTAPFRLDIQDGRVFPSVSLSQIANTSCDGVNFDGQITVTASTSNGPGMGANYDFVWTTVPGGSAVANPGIVASPYATSNLDVIGPGPYSVQVSNAVTQCQSNGSITLQTNTVPMEIVSVTATHVDQCAPLLVNGSGTVTDVKIGALVGQSGLFDYTWDNDPLMGSPFITNDPALSQGGLDVGIFYVRARRNAVPNPATPGVTGSGCLTAPIPFEVLDKRITPSVSLSQIANTSCDGVNFDGQITVTASTANGPGMGANYDFVWTTIPGGSAAANPGAVASPYSTSNPDVIGPGSYSVQVSNTVTQCQSNGSITLQTNTVPMEIVNVVATHVDQCLPLLANGSGTVTDVTISGVSSIGSFDFAWDDDVAFGSPLPSVTFNQMNLDVGNNFVRAQRQIVVSPGVPGVTGSGCFTAPIPFEVQDKRITPSVSLSQIANTSCDGVNFDGQITVTASTASGPGAGANYDFAWTTIPGGSAAANPGAVASPYSTSNPDVIGPGSYSVQVSNTVTQCQSNGSITLQTNTLPMEIVNVVATHVDQCLPLLANGSGTVTDVTISGVSSIGSFDFAWDDDVAFGSPLPSVTFNQMSLDVGNYFVRAQRQIVVSPGVPGVTGSGCFTAPIPFEVLDKRITPSVSLSQIANTACDGNFDGQITVTSSTASGPGAGANYDFVWTSVPLGSAAVNPGTVASPYSTSAPDIIGPGSYAVQVTNANTSCASAGTIVLISNPQPLDVLTVNKTDQLICNPDGSITVSALSSGGLGNYTYQWYKNDPATAPLVDNFTNPITIASIVPGTAAQEFPTMGFGAYFVRATKNAGVGVGSGCVTPPFRVDVRDLHKDPRVQLSYQPNSSCDPINPNGAILANALEQSGLNTDTYSFTWTFNGGALPGSTTITPTSNSNQLANAGDGNYVLVIQNTSATGCQFTSSLPVEKNLNNSLPNIIDAITVDPLDCLASGSATVTRVGIGGITFFNDPPDDLDLNFNYKWFQGNLTNQLVAEVNHNMINKSPGTYYVTVLDGTTLCESGPKEVIIKDDLIIYPDVRIAQTARQISCNAITGTAALASTADGQTDANADYNFTWYNTLDATGPSFANSSTITGQQLGDYSVEVLRTSTGCSAQALFIVPDEAPQFTPIISLGGQGRTLCVGQDGLVLARVIDISTQYPFPFNFTADLYNGSSPNLANPPDVPNMAQVPGFATNFAESALAEGFYTIRITDNNTGCFAVATQEVLDQRTNPVVTIVEDNPLTNCDPAIANGQLSASADGGKVGGYTFSWFAGTAVASPPSAVLGSINKLIGLGAGDYVVSVANKITGCIGDLAGLITDATLIPPIPEAVTLRDRTNCIVPNGLVAASVGGVTFGYDFNWYDGVTVSGTPDFNGVNYFDLEIGDYSVTATDIITGCISNPATTPVADARRIPEFVIETTPSFCIDTGKPKGNGSVILTLTNADGDKIVIDDVEWVDIATNQPVGNGSALYDLFPGFYQANAVTFEGCTNEGIAEVRTEISAYNGISNNNDGSNDVFIVDCISLFPNNNVKIFNRNGIKVYEMDGYNNADIAFTGVGLSGIYLQGKELPVGTYYYIIDKRDGTKPVAGYLELDR